MPNMSRFIRSDIDEFVFFCQNFTMRERPHIFSAIHTAKT